MTFYSSNFHHQVRIAGHYTNNYKINTMYKLLKKVFPLLIASSLFTISCFTKQNTVKYKNHKILSKVEINNFIREEIKNKGKFRWEAASDHLIYSALMHTDDGILYITYRISPDGPELPNYGDSNKLPKEWINKRDEIVQYILEKERKYRNSPNLEINDLLPPWNTDLDNRLPSISFQITDPSIISELRKDKTITRMTPGYESGIHILYEK